MKNLNWIDRAVAYVAPQAGLRRARVRAAMEVLSAYEAARTGRSLDGWVTSGSDANTALDGDLQRMRDRSRDLIRNNAMAFRLKSLIAGGAVGTGIIPQADTGFEAVDRVIDETFKAWCEECDADGQADFFGIQRLVADGVFESGEAVVRRRLRRPQDGMHVSLQLQVMEADHIDLAQQTNNSGGVTVQGVEFDAIGRRAGYWLYPTHPGATVRSLRDSMQSRFVPGTEIAHVYTKSRPGQVHGAPALSTVIPILRFMDEYNEAVIVSVRTAACLGLFVTQPEDPGTGTIGKATTEDPTTGARLEKMRPGMIVYGKPGEDVKAIVPSGPTNFVDYMKFEQSLAAIGLNAFYAQAAGDLSAVNWASFRAGDRDYRAAIEAFRWLYLEPMFLQVVWRWFIDAAYLAGRIPEPLYGVRWTPPRFLSVDPKKDAEADEAAMANGTLTYPEAVAAQGFDPQTQLDQIAKWIEKIDEKGLTFAWDRRKVGAQAKAALPAAVEE